VDRAVVMRVRKRILNTMAVRLAKSGRGGAVNFRCCADI